MLVVRRLAGFPDHCPDTMNMSASPLSAYAPAAAAAIDAAGPVPVLVIGAGIMGAGIAQVAAQAGHPVWLHDTRPGAARAACDQLALTLRGLVAKGRLAADAAESAIGRLAPVDSLAQAGEAGLAVEAIVEQLDAKRALLQSLEQHLAPSAVLASNTSSISITALARGLRHPGRVVGMHFFNPVPLMKLVEVVSGLQTEPAVAERVFALARTWGKTAVHARSTPGFIVNRIARPYYAETLALLQERAAPPQVLDACLRGAGFRMGPCELMDLIGHDTNFSVTESVFQAHFGDKRYQPSLVQRELVDGGLLGRKSGRGFYTHGESAVTPALPAPRTGTLPAVVRWQAPADAGEAVAAFGAHWCQALEQAGVRVERAAGAGWIGLEQADAAGPRRLALTDGRLAVHRSAGDSVPTALFDLPLGAPGAGAALAWAAPAGADEAWKDTCAALLACAGVRPLEVDDTPGLVVARTVAMLVNEAADAVQQGVCSEAGADLAMKLGVNYPAGPFEWLARWDLAAVVRLLDALDAFYRGERYRVSPWLRRRCLPAGRAGSAR